MHKQEEKRWCKDSKKAVICKSRGEASEDIKTTYILQFQLKQYIEN
jgi:hypothetical protein